MHTVSHIATNPSQHGEGQPYPPRGNQKFITQITPWAPGHASVPFEVVLQEISDARVVLLHERPLQIGLRHILTVPQEGGKPITREYLIHQCALRSDAIYEIVLIPADGKTQPPARPEKKRVTSKQLKILFLLFGIFGLFIAAFAPL